METTALLDLALDGYRNSTVAFQVLDEEEVNIMIGIFQSMFGEAETFFTVRQADVMKELANELIKEENRVILYDFIEKITKSDNEYLRGYRGILDSYIPNSESMAKLGLMLTLEKIRKQKGF